MGGRSMGAGEYRGGMYRSKEVKGEGSMGEENLWRK